MPPEGVTRRRSRGERAAQRRGAVGVGEDLGEDGLERVVHADVEERRLDAQARDHRQQRCADLEAPVARLAGRPQLRVRSGERGVGRSLEAGGQLGPVEHAEQLGGALVEGEGVAEHRLVVVPDHVAGGLARDALHVEVVVELAQEDHRVLDERDLVAFAPPQPPVVEAEEARQRVRVVDEALDRPQQQRLLGGQRLTGRRARHPLHQRGGRHLDVDVPGQGLERADRGEVGRHEARVGLHHRLEAEGPVHEAVVERHARLEVVAAQLHAPEDLGEPLEVVLAAGSVAEHERDVRVVGAREVVVGEGPGVGVARADALVVAMLEGQGLRPAPDDAAGVGLERGVHRVHPHLGAGDRPQDALGLRQPRAVQLEQHHGLDQPLDVEEVLGIVRVAEAHPVGELGAAVLHLDARVHLHEEVVVALDDALEGGDVVEADALAEAGGVRLHGGQGLAVLDEHLPVGGVLGLLRGAREQLVGERELELLLLEHLDRAVAAAEGDGPIAVAHDLDLVVPGRLEVQLDQEVPVRAGLHHLLLGEDVGHRGRGLGGVRDDALALAAAAADALVADALAGVLLPDPIRLALGGLLQLLDRHELDRLRVAGEQELFGVVDELEVRVPLELESVLGGERLQRLAVRHAVDERQGGHVVDAGDDRVAERAGELLRLVLGAGAAQDRRGGADEAKARGLDGFDEVRVLGHEAVAGEDVGVAVALADRDDLADPLELLLLARAHVVRDAMDVGGEREVAQLRRETARVDHRVLLGEQHAPLADADLGEDVERLLADRTATDDQALHVRDVEAPDPLRVRIDRPNLLALRIQHGPTRAPAARRPSATARTCASGSRGSARGCAGSRRA